MKTWLGILLLFFSVQNYAQNISYKSIDSLLLAVKTQKEDTSKCRSYNIISRVYVYKNNDEGLRYAQLGLALATKLKWQKGIGLSHTSQGMHLISKGNYKAALKILLEAEKIFMSLKDAENLARVYNQIGILKANLAKFPESLDYFFLSLKKFESLKKDDFRSSIASCYENIGTIYNLTNSFEKAIINYKKAIAILQEMRGHELEYAMNLANLGTIYQKQGQFEYAINTYKTAEKQLLLLQDEFGLAFVNSWMGSAYLEQKKYDLSIEKSNLAVDAVVKSGDKELMTTTIQNLGNAHLKKAMIFGEATELNLAFKNLSLSLKMHQELGNHEGLIKDYLYLSEYYRYQKEYAKSLYAHIKFAAYNDSVFNFKNKQSLQNLEDERTISLRNKEIELNKVTLESKEKQKRFFILGLALLGFIGGLLFYQSHNRRKINEKLHLLNLELDLANKTKARFFSILNHDLRSPVSNLIHFLHLQKESPELLDVESKLRMENKTIAGAENLLTSMEDILLWSKGQMENFKPQLKSMAIETIFEDTKNHFLSEEKIAILFENTNHLSINTDENYLKTIMRNLTGNAIKALQNRASDNTEKPTIVWKTWKENNSIYLSITDNGNGANQEQFKALYDETEVVGIKTGLGLHLIRDLAKAIGCNITVQSKQGFGTTFTLILP